jgi:hypothetical protein
MEPEGSLPYSQVPATCPYPEPTPPSLQPLLRQVGFAAWGRKSDLTLTNFNAHSPFLNFLTILSCKQL